MRDDRINSNTAQMSPKHNQEPLLLAFDEYMERLALYAGIARDYGAACDLAGMAHALRSAKAYLKAAHGELAAILQERVEEAGASEVAEQTQAAAATRAAADKEWWEE